MKPAHPIQLALFFLLLPLFLHASPPPNIVLVMADDMGYTDIGCYGSEIDTPNLDRLAANGLRFTQFYNTSRCCPTRAALLTGLYSHQVGIGLMTGDRGYDAYRGDLNKRCVTIAEALKPAGYTTYMSGKWHVTKQIKPDGDKSNWPKQRGFDRFFGTIHGAGSFYDPNSLTLENTQVAPGRDDFYYTDAINDFAAQFIYDHHEKDHAKPFFMYVAHTAPHWSMHAKPKDIEKYKGRYKDGWNALRRERHERMIKMGLVDEKWPLSPDARQYEEAKDKAFEERCMEVYAAMVDSMDQGIGRIIEALEGTGEFQNTLIIFIADNGGCAEGMGRGKLNHDPVKITKLEPMGEKELQTGMIPRKTRDGKPMRMGYGVMPGPADTYIGYGQGWANASNTPFREYKHWVHEGGIGSPFIAHWPDGIKRKGELEHQPAHLIDLMATAVDLSKAEYPEKFSGEKIQPMEGRSLVPAFGGKEIQRDALYWEHEGNRAVRVGDLKLVAKGRNGPWELYDLSKDRTELNDLSEKMPEKAKELAALWQAYAERTNVVPWPGQKKKKPAPKKEE